MIAKLVLVGIALLLLGCWPVALPSPCPRDFSQARFQTAKELDYALRFMETIQRMLVQQPGSDPDDVMVVDAERVSATLAWNREQVVSCPGDEKVIP